MAFSILNFKITQNAYVINKIYKKVMSIPNPGIQPSYIGEN